MPLSESDVREILRLIDESDVEELRVLLSFEEAHKARKGVLATVRDRLTELENRVQQAQE